jgi:outer membrane protein
MRNLLLFALWLVPGLAFADPTRDPDAPLATLLEAQLGRAGGITAEQVARRAEGDSPAIRASQAQLRAANENTEVSSLAYLPRSTATARYTRLSHMDEPQGLPIEIPQIQNQWVFEMSLDVPLSDYLLRLPHERRAAVRTEEAAGLSLAATRRSVGSNARLVYWNWVRARLGVVVTEQAKAQAVAHLEDARALHDVGTASRADVLRAESAVASADLALARARGSEARLADRLRTVARLPRNQPLEIGDGLTDRPGARSPSVDVLLADAYHARPELRSMQLLADAERARGTAIRAAAYPRLNGFATQTQANPNQRMFPQRAEFDSSWQAGVGISWGLSGIASALASGRAADARADAIDEDQLALRDTIRQDVVEAAESIREADTSLGTTAQGLVAAEESHRVRRELFRAGRATAAEMVDAETELTRARLDAVQARIDRRVAEVRLAEAVGR